MFGAWYDNTLQKARPIEELMAAFEQGGSAAVNAACSEGPAFTAGEWKAFSEKEKADTLMRYRLAYQGESTVNWCPALGTVLANDEVKDGYSERGGQFSEQQFLRFFHVFFIYRAEAATVLLRLTLLFIK